MFRRYQNQHGAFQSISGGAVCAQDLAETLLANDSQYQPFATWLDGELERLELRFADFATPSSLTRPLARHAGV